uniref:Uncharacterized protein n=1 Tax=Arundo donax TaxID=35708 RepID=A0A0A8ZFK4_ARUDO
MLADQVFVKMLQRGIQQGHLNLHRFEFRWLTKVLDG